MQTNRYYKPELDAVRLLAFLFVFFTHRMDLAPIDKADYYWGYHLSLVGVFGHCILPSFLGWFYSPKSQIYLEQFQGKRNSLLAKALD